MNYIDWYIKQLADHNLWVRIPTLLAACITVPFILIGNGYAILLFILIGIALSAASNYYKRY